MARRGRPKHPDILTPREWEVLALLREGRTNEEIAERLGISYSTARFHVSEILGKLGVSSRDEAARWQPEPRERRSWLLAPLGLLRRSSPLGAGAQVAGGGVLAIALAGVVLLAWGVFSTSGHTDSGAREAAGTVANSTAIACETPEATLNPGPELGTAPIFWRFGVTEHDLTSGHYCGRDVNLVIRVTNGSTGGSATVQAGSLATGEHISAEATRVTPLDVALNDPLSGVSYATSFTLPSAGEWRLQVRFGSDFSTQTVRIGGADVPTLAGGPDPPCAPPEQQPGGGTPMAVVLVERATGECHVIPTADRLMQAQWVEDGKTFVAYDNDENAFVIYDLDGNPLHSIGLKTPEDGSIGGAVSPSPDGRTILVDRKILDLHQPLTTYDVANDTYFDFPKPAGDNHEASYSPDGAHAVYVNTNNGKQSLVVATTPLTDGLYTIIRSIDAERQYIAPLAWSPDGAYLLLMTGELGVPCVSSPDPQCRQFQTQTFEVIAVDRLDTAEPVWSSGVLPPSPSTVARWMGPSELLFSRPATTTSAGVTFEAKTILVSIPEGRETTQPTAYTDIGELSPDGEAAMRGNDLVELESGESVEVVEFDASYYADWTADSRQVLLSFGGN